LSFAKAAAHLRAAAFLFLKLSAAFLPRSPRGIAAAAYAKKAPQALFLNAAGPPVVLLSSASADFSLVFCKGRCPSPGGGLSLFETLCGLPAAVSSRHSRCGLR